MSDGYRISSALCVFPGVVEGEALVSGSSFPLSGVTFEFASGKVRWPGHDLNGQTVRDRVLVLPEIRGFAGGDWALFSLSALYKTAPRAILCGDVGSFIAAGAILGKIVTVAQLSPEFLRGIENGAHVSVDSGAGVVRASGAGSSPTREAKFNSMKQDAADFELTSEERAMLAGSRGRAAAECLAFLVDYGKAVGADRLIKVDGVHAAGSGYNTTGEAVIAFLTRLSEEGARVEVPSTLNPIALDLTRWRDVMHMPPDLLARQVDLNSAFERIGFSAIYSCAPYWTGNVPGFGSNVAWSEHNAVSFANSVIGARTNFESNIATIAAAVTGRIPYYGLYKDENRRPQVTIELHTRLHDPVDWRCLGVVAARAAGARIPLFRGLCDKPTEQNLRDLCSSFGPPWTGVPLLHVEGVTPESPAGGGANPVGEVIHIGAVELERVREEFRGGADDELDLVALGCPQYSLSEIQEVAEHLRGRQVKQGVQLWLWTDAGTRAVADARGLVGEIERAGGQVLADTCGCAACPLQRSEFMFRGVATDSTKSCSFLGRTGLRTHLGSIEECIQAAESGRWPGRPRPAVQASRR